MFRQWHFYSLRRCVAEKGEDAPECNFYQRAYRSLCPSEWVEGWNTAREEGNWFGEHCFNHCCQRPTFQNRARIVLNPMCALHGHQAYVAVVACLFANDAVFPPCQPALL